MLKKHVPWIIGALFILAVMSPVVRSKDWVLLGTAHVDGTVDHDTIDVTASEGPFHKVQLRVNGGSVEFQRVVVHFKNGTQEELPIRERVRSGGKSRAFDLPGEHRMIESVELWYSKEKWDTRPDVSAYASR
jgi:hypothetical protein